MYEERVRKLTANLEDYAYYKAVFSEDEQEAQYHYTEYQRAKERGIAQNMVLRDGEEKGIYYRVFAFPTEGGRADETSLSQETVKALADAIDKVSFDELVRETVEPKGFSTLFDEGGDGSLESVCHRFPGIGIGVIASEKKEEIECPVTVYVKDELGVMFWAVADKYIDVEYERGSAGYEESENALFELFGTMMESAIQNQCADDPEKQRELRAAMDSLMKQFGADSEEFGSEAAMEDEDGIPGSEDDWAALSFEEYKEILNEVMELPEEEPEAVSEEAPYWKRFAVLLSALSAKTWKFPVDTLELGKATPVKEKRVREILDDAWGVKTREDLISTLDWLFKEGQTEDYRMYYEAESVEDVLLEDMEPEEERAARAEYRVVSKMRDVTNMNTMLAWDLGRGVMLARLGYFAGMLTRRETEQMLSDIAVGLTGIFSSWREYAAAYLFGAMYWSYPDSSKADTSELFIDLYHMVKELLAENGEWRRNPWIE